MTIKPDALLIFRARDMDSTSTKKKVGKKEELLLKSVNEPMLPLEERPKELGKYQKKEELSIQTKTQSTSEKKDIIVQKPTEQIKQTVQAQPQKEPETVNVAEKPTPESKPVGQTKEKENVNLISYDIFRKRAPKAQFEEQKSIYSEQPTPHELADDSNSIRIYANKEYITKRGNKTDQATLSREAAKNQNCVWHPWRQAYAICSYCHRPFCFEDTVEFNRAYYCLQDIDNVSYNYKETASSNGYTLGIISGILFLASFIIFFYYSNAQVIYVLEYLNKVGIGYFLIHINYNYAFALIESVFMLLEFAAAMLIFVQSRKGFYLGVMASLGTVALFSYVYINTATLYLGFIDGLIFVSFVALLYSKTTSVSDDVTTTRVAAEKSILKWPNVSRF